MTWQILQGDALSRLGEMPAESVQCCVTSPPYWGLCDYGVEHVDWPAISYDLPGGQVEVPEMNCSFGLEETPEQFIGHAVLVFKEVRRALRADGTLWLNIGDSYSSGSRTGQVVDGKAAGEQRAAIRPATIPGLKPKDLVGIPWMLAFALRADGWWLRAENIWNKKNPMPESVLDRPTRAHEQLFLLAKSGSPTFWTHRDGSSSRTRPEPDYRWVHPETGEESMEPQPKPWRRINLWRGHDYFYDAKAIREPATYAGPNGRQQSPYARSPEQERQRRDKQRGHGRRHDDFNDRWDAMSKDEQQALGRNKRSVWTIATRPFPEAHFATFPTDLVEPCILAGSKRGDTILDPFAGAATTILVARQLGRDAIGIELNPEYVALGEQRIRRWEANPAGHLTEDPEPMDGQLSIEAAA